MVRRVAKTSLRLGRPQGRAKGLGNTRTMLTCVVVAFVSVIGSKATAVSLRTQAETIPPDRVETRFRWTTKSDERALDKFIHAQGLVCLVPPSSSKKSGRSIRLAKSGGFCETILVAGKIGQGAVVLAAAQAFGDRPCQYEGWMPVKVRGDKKGCSQATTFQWRETGLSWNFMGSKVSPPLSTFTVRR